MSVHVRNEFIKNASLCTVVVTTLFNSLFIEATATSTHQSHFVLVGTYGGVLYCILADTGVINWKFKDCQDIIKTKPAVYENHVVFACHDGFVRCLNIAQY